MRDAVLVDAVRTPIGKIRGGLARVRADDLAVHVLSALLDRVEGARGDLEEVIFGDTNQAGEDNRDVARMAVLLAGLPVEVTGVTVNRLCGSGLEAVVQAARAVRLGDHDVIVAGGVESMSRAPYVMAKPEEGFPRRTPEMHDSSLGWRFVNPKMRERFEIQSMGETAENVAERYAVSREDQDAFAADSHRKATAAWDAGAFDREVVPVTVPPASKRDAPTTFDRDECIRPETSAAKLAKLPAVFRSGGSVTAGNASPLNDGAAAVLLASSEWAARRGVRPLARVLATAVAGVEPNFMGIGPIPATRKVLQRAGLTVDQLDVVELNEAFAAQSLACIRELGLDPAKVNVNGGAIALGHPIGCSGARILGSLVHAMRGRDAKLGLATLCIGVGQGMAVVVERIDS
ncbi:MAG: thiolase family protein [Myxococcota bacterium]